MDKNKAMETELLPRIAEMIECECDVLDASARRIARQILDMVTSFGVSQHAHPKSLEATHLPRHLDDGTST